MFLVDPKRIRIVLRGVAAMASSLAVISGSLVGQEPTTVEAESDGSVAEVAPLFASDAVLAFTLHAPIDGLKGDRRDGVDERPAEIHLDDGTPPVTLKVRTRGNFRLQRSTCPSLPPIRLNFPKGDVAGTVFAGQDKVKLVTHCRGRDSDEQNLLQEYLAYRVFNELTPSSFMVRLARITYVDSERPDDEPFTKYAFIIEDEDALAERLGGMMLEVPAVHPTEYDRDAMLLVALFQYMVGNTDWSLVQFHNIKLFQTGDARALPIPYDFDWTGLVNAPYAEPDPSVRVRSVRDRVYRGYCVDGLDYQGMAMHIRERASAVLGLIDQIEGMSDDTRSDSRRYLQGFFEILEDPSAYDRNVVGRCRALN